MHILVFLEINLFQQLSVLHAKLRYVTSLTDDFYHYEESSYEMIGERTNKHYKLGQKVKVIVADTDKIMRTIDFRVVRDDVEPDEADMDEASVLSKRTD